MPSLLLSCDIDMEKFHGLRICTVIMKLFRNYTLIAHLIINIYVSNDNSLANIR